MRKSKLSVVLATRNEERNIGICLQSVKDIADEIIVCDEGSTDKTISMAKIYGSKVFTVKHEENFHITKQKAIEKTSGDWILQLDADEKVTKELSKEIESVVDDDHSSYISKSIAEKDLNYKNKLFQRHQRLIEQRRGSLGDDKGEVVAYFIPRVNYFLGKPLLHAGVYPDGVIRLFKKGKARLPGKSVHELMEVDGKLSWLYSDLEHHDSPTLERYLDRANRYTDLTAKEMKESNVNTNYLTLFYYSFIKPFLIFVSLYFKHKGILDGMRGFVWSIFSALHYPIAYFKYWQKVKG